MEKLTLLEMVQDVLGSMGNDKVSDVGESEDAEDVVAIIRAEYNKMMSVGDWPHLKTAKNLTAGGDSTKPTLMKVPSDVAEVVNIRYNKIKSGATAPDWDDVTYLEPDEFLEMISGRNKDNTSVSSQISNHVEILYYNDQAPNYYTSFNDSDIIFDAIDTGVDTTLQSSKSVAQVIKTITFTASNGLVLDLPARMFPTLLSKCRVVANELIEQRDIKTDANDARTGLNRLRHKKNAVTTETKVVNYGRQTR